MGLFNLGKKKTRKFRVDRGTATRVADKLGLSVVHVSLVIRGKREGGPALIEELSREEEAQARERGMAVQH